MKIVDIEDSDFLLQRGGFENEKQLAVVKQILKDVKEKGNQAVFELEEKFDNTILTKDTLQVSQEEIAEAYQQIDKKLLESLRLAIKNIFLYHTRNKMKGDIRTDELGRTTGYTVRAVESAGIYVPGGTAPLFSSVCMGILPAKAAGVEHVYVTTPAKNGKINPATLVAACECGAEAIYKIGGAQAIASLAYGTETVPKVNVIAGPGNIFVTLAKKEVLGQVGIDMLAGPSEILIVCDNSANPSYVAADMLSQAEHDKLARAIVLTDDRAFAEQVKKEVEKQLPLLTRKEIAEYSTEYSGGIVVCKDIIQAIELANKVAPEHMEIYTKNAEELLPLVKNAGAVFLGGYTPEPVGDYFAGPDHILPTGGTAKFFQVLNQDIFLRKMSVISYSKQAILKDGEDIIRLAENEGLTAHANAVKIRLENEK